ncbi:glucose-1-phosphate thymidylyltransferase RfbA [Candidatus Arthromitus sp. SFB-turkey]|uniref:glucose-1-phosphate thymidylyltransferase RfbA n=1 Tax=Candidatus Arthromitus sp. SFB-turkey TaxID=1840217 RepID=UPI0007F44F12|nr:glucose-1-phosphate thymidylyltransferase RfbA [Candidatus Arthromitus sp. SFB-turkey]OAT88249.1 glucose-1-phosphate thymidylyltransferase [Candidatus Arthromitus sp. SFB-turkey]HJD00008.1 glucose-1-phosphate thymidylyltransferase RfbA [Candidatus Dwaynia gallinarum]
MKGIILAGGVASRMFPITLSITKQLLPVYDKPMIYYSISTFMIAGIRDILIIVSPNQIENFKNLLGDGSQFGININYEIQQNPNGLPEAFIIGENFIKNNKVALILGDNIFYGNEFSYILKNSIEKHDGATIFLYPSNNPENFGVVEFSDDRKIISIEEKPENPKSNYIVTGLYLYDENVSYYSKSLRKSSRGELEITDLNNIYLKNEKLNYEILGKGFSWIDTGTFDSLYEACEFIKILEKRQGIKISVPEEIAYRNKWISEEELYRQAFKYKNNSYGKYLNKIIDEGKAFGGKYV